MVRSARVWRNGAGNNTFRYKKSHTDAYNMYTTQTKMPVMMSVVSESFFLTLPVDVAVVLNSTVMHCFDHDWGMSPKQRDWA